VLPLYLTKNVENVGLSAAIEFVNGEGIALLTEFLLGFLYYFANLGNYKILKLPKDSIRNQY
jgi:hypothetical protein